MNDDVELIRPFAAVIPASAFAQKVIAPPYDVISSAEAREVVKKKPLSFLHVSKPEIDLPEDISVYSDEVYVQGAENFKQLFNNAVLRQVPNKSYFIYQMKQGEHTQLGIAATVSVASYLNNRVRKHEQTRPSKEDDRVKHMLAVKAQVSPVLLTCHSHPELEDLLESYSASTPDMDVLADDGVRHSIWTIEDEKVKGRISHLFNDEIKVLYVADGHHRTAAAARVAEQLAGSDESDLSQYCLAVIFPQNHLRILSYNRVISGLNGLSAEEFLQKLAADFLIEPVNAPVQPEQSKQYGLYLAGQWYRLIYRHPNSGASALEQLDVSVLNHTIIEPLLAITDQRRDPRIDFVGGFHSLTKMQALVDKGERDLAISLYPTQIHELLAVADADQLMPPKSTWFEPKLADGLLAYKLTRV